MNNKNMDNNSICLLPVSIGEALDKLTILDIKLSNIKDDRRNDVEIEYNMLYNKLYTFIDNYPNLYKQLKHVNLLIWEMMDKLRDSLLDDDIYFKECKRCVEYNDIRFRIKNKINNKTNSLIKEQKGYLVNYIKINIEDDVNIDIIIRPIKYLSLIKDLVIIYFNNNHNIKKYFEDDVNIVFMDDTIIDYICITSCMNTEQILNLLNINISDIDTLII